MRRRRVLRVGGRSTNCLQQHPESASGNVASEGPEAYAFSELGDGLNLVAEPASSTLSQVTVVLSSWGCQSGHWYSNDCVSSPSGTFSQPITVNVYSLGDLVTPLATVTQTFALPYRPSSTPAKCAGDATEWYSAKDKACHHGIAVPVTVNFGASNETLPSSVVVTVAYNTTHYGPAPIGEAAACFTSSGGCPYDSLNISTEGDGGLTGTVVDPNGIYVNYSVAGQGCGGLAVPGTLALDTGCWAGFHPEIQVVTKH
jgi:hypothetical protein